VRRSGITATLCKAVTALRVNDAADEFDARYGTTTRGVEPLWKLNIRSSNARHGVHYKPSDEQELKDAIDFLGEDPAVLTFVDLGCGKGRTLIVASALGFERIIGVEFAAELVEIARANLMKLQINNTFVVHTDAAEFDFEDRDMVVYLYNPFSAPVMEAVLRKLEVTRSRRLYVVYKNPVCAPLLDACRFLRPLGIPPARPSIKVWTRESGPAQ
jgi:SAM-dependent methyltransferase